MAIDMAEQTAPADPRQCKGSKTFGIEPHLAPLADFPLQPSRADGIGRMCKPHWNEYTTKLRQASNARRAEGVAPRERKPKAEAAPKAPRKTKKDAELPALPAEASETRAAPRGAAVPGRRIGSTPQGQRFAPVNGAVAEDAIGG